jgi:CyaY protein
MIAEENCQSTAGRLCRMISGMDERTFQRNSETAMERLTRALYAVEEAAGFEVEERGGALQLDFEEPPGTFVISPNSSAGQIWISALTTSFKLDWSEAYADFVLGSSGEPLLPLVGRLITEQTGNAVVLQ